MNLLKSGQLKKNFQFIPCSVMLKEWGIPKINIHPRWSWGALISRMPHSPSALSLLKHWQHFFFIFRRYPMDRIGVLRWKHPHCFSRGYICFSKCPAFRGGNVPSLQVGIQVKEFETLGKLWNLERELERSNKIAESSCGRP